MAQRRKLGFGADHAGFELKLVLADHVRKQGHEVIDFGTHGPGPVDYPDYAEKVARAVAGADVDRGVLICGSGVGVSVAANKVRGVRAGLCHDTYSAHQGVEHDDMNCLVLGARIVGEALAKELLDAFIKAEFTGEERHTRRLAKVLALEEQLHGDSSD